MTDFQPVPCWSSNSVFQTKKPAAAYLGHLALAGRLRLSGLRQVSAGGGARDQGIHSGSNAADCSQADLGDGRYR